MTARAPNVHARSAGAGAPDARPRNASNDGSRLVDVIWHAEGSRSSERCTIRVGRNAAGVPVIVISTPYPDDPNAPIVTYDGPIEGVDEIDETVPANKDGE